MMMVDDMLLSERSNFIKLSRFSWEAYNSVLLFILHPLVSEFNQLRPYRISGVPLF